MSNIGKTMQQQLDQNKESLKKAASIQTKDIFKNGLSMQGGQYGTAGSIATQLISPIQQFTTSQNKTVDQGTLSLRNSISDFAIQSGNPYAMAIGAATKVLDMIGDSTGYHIDDIDKDAGSRAGVTGIERFANNAISAIPGMGLLMAIGSPEKTGDVDSLTREGMDMMPGYASVIGNMNTADTLSGKRTLFGIGQKKMNNFIQNASNQVNVVNDIGRVNTLAKRSDYDANIAQQNLNRYAGTNYMTYAVGKKGMKILSRRELQAILATRKLQKGGVIGTDTNLLPDGALHARLNHLDEVNPELEDVTRKGIPVLDGQGNQVAEIENSELILRLEITKKIEELMKQDTDEAMIEAGKLLVAEIIDNTQDNTGQITEEVENGK